MWNRENTESFLELYRSFTCLWKRGSEDYKDYALKNRAYQKLVEFCQTYVDPHADREFVVKRIQGMRGAFRKELNKVKESVRKGDVDVHQPRLWYFNLLLFTKDEEELQSDNFSNEDDGVCSKTLPQVLLDFGGEETQQPKESPKEDPLQSALKKICKNMQSRKRRNISSAAFSDEFSPARKKSSFSGETSEYDAVGINVSRKLDKMNERQAIHAENLINQVLNRGLLNLLSQNTTLVESIDVYEDDHRDYNKLST